MSINAFIKFENPELKGESADSEHVEWIQVLTWAHSFNQPTSPTRSSAGGGTVEQANHADFTLTKYLDAATDDLLKMCWSGKQIEKATFQVFRADGNNKPIKYLEILFEDIIISNVSLAGSVGDLPAETIALAYSKVTYNYIPQVKADGTSSGVQPVTHDLKNQEVS